MDSSDDEDYAGWYWEPIEPYHKSCIQVLTGKRNVLDVRKYLYDVAMDVGWEFCPHLVSIRTDDECRCGNNPLEGWKIPEKIMNYHHKVMDRLTVDIYRSDDFQRQILQDELEKLRLWFLLELSIENIWQDSLLETEKYILDQRSLCSERIYLLLMKLEDKIKRCGHRRSITPLLKQLEKAIVQYKDIWPMGKCELYVLHVPDIWKSTFKSYFLDEILDHLMRFPIVYNFLQHLDAVPFDTRLLKRRKKMTEINENLSPNFQIQTVQILVQAPEDICSSSCDRPMESLIIEDDLYAWLREEHNLIDWELPNETEPQFEFQYKPTLVPIMDDYDSYYMRPLPWYIEHLFKAVRIVDHPAGLTPTYGHPRPDLADVLFDIDIPPFCLENRFTRKKTKSRAYRKAIKDYQQKTLNIQRGTLLKKQCAWEQFQAWLSDIEDGDFPFKHMSLLDRFPLDYFDNEDDQKDLLFRNNDLKKLNDYFQEMMIQIQDYSNIGSSLNAKKCRVHDTFRCLLFQRIFIKSILALEKRQYSLQSQLEIIKNYANNLFDGSENSHFSKKSESVDDVGVFYKGTLLNDVYFRQVCQHISTWTRRSKRRACHLRDLANRLLKQKRLFLQSQYQNITSILNVFLKFYSRFKSDGFVCDSSSLNTHTPIILR